MDLSSDVEEDTGRKESEKRLKMISPSRSTYLDDVCAMAEEDYKKTLAFIHQQQVSRDKDSKKFLAALEGAFSADVISPSDLSIPAGNESVLAFAQNLLDVYHDASTAISAHQPLPSGSKESPEACIGRMPEVQGDELLDGGFRKTRDADRELIKAVLEAGKGVAAGMEISHEGDGEIAPTTSGVNGSEHGLEAAKAVFGVEAGEGDDLRRESLCAMMKGVRRMLEVTEKDI